MAQWSAEAGPKDMLLTRACAGSLPSTSCSPPSRAIPGSFPTKLPVALLTLNKTEQNKLELEQNNFTICMEPQQTPNSQNNLEKEEQS